MSLTKKIAAGVMTGALALATFAPSVFAADLEITDNGAGSVNTISVHDVSVCDVDQNNLTLVGGIVSASASTGGNQANGNTGGNVSVTSGNATATATNTVTGGNNTAVNPCCCDTGCDGASEPSATISDNGRRSRNRIDVAKVSVSDVDQNNATIVFGKVKAKAKTGWNKANGNTGGGTTTVLSGTATAGATNTVTGGSNSITNP
ncbi:MAG: hypothetical protein A2868_00935 [Candidatus Levybacteria bacterium RIFCSPHIGHO2_01_FULL_40_15b]|nr:MAG: hypothetical protein A2868_00935 [Candidatus Levybacteria bacterium RIFCSPHIGHO2_01_FULL_40_15b]